MQASKNDASIQTKPSSARSSESLNLNKRIFLSHSGHDKPFVVKLFKALLEKGYDPFFDKTLPKAVRITMKGILEEVDKSKLCLFVLSKEFFMNTKNPMLELSSFVKARKKYPSKKILPLFYNLSVPQFKDKQIQRTWIMKWEEWKEEDNEKGYTESDVNVKEWEEALEIINDTNGIERKEMNEGQYIQDIVSQICRIITPDVQYDVSHVQGTERMCKEVDDLFVQRERDPSRDLSRACILGMHGMGGIGKTTLSKVLFHHYWSEFEGYVIRVELDCPSKESTLRRLRTVLQKLQAIHEEILVPLDDVDQAWFVLLRAIVQKKVFFILDNANVDSMEEIYKYLKCVFHRESKVFILSRSKKLLEELCLSYPNFHIVKMLSLRVDEAECIFQQSFHSSEPLLDYKILRDGINLCFFEGAYHPMALDVLGLWMKQKDRESAINYLSENRTRELGSSVISLLKDSFNDMKESSQRILIDIALYLPSQDSAYNWDPYEWLSSVNDMPLAKVNYVVAELRNRGFLCDGGLKMHELVKELAVEVVRIDKSLGCVYFDSQSQPWNRLEYSTTTNVERLAMKKHKTHNPVLSLEGFHLLGAMKIEDVEGLKEIRMGQNMKRLRSLEVSSSKSWNNLTDYHQIKRQKLCNAGSVIIKRLGQCENLDRIYLENCVDSKLMQPQHSIDSTWFGSKLRIIKMITGKNITFPLQNLRNSCNCLEELYLDGFGVGETCLVSRFPQLQHLSLINCLSTRHLQLDSLFRLKKLVIKRCSSLEYLGVCSLSILEGLSIRNAPELKNICSLERCASSFVSLELHNCSSLDYLDLSSLCLLQYLNINYCKKLYRLEGLQKLDSLKKLRVHNCFELASLFEGVVRGEDEDSSSFLTDLSHELELSKCPKLTDKFSNVNYLKSFELVGTTKILNYEFVEDVLDRWDELFTMMEEREISDYGLIENVDVARWKRERMVGAISQPQTITVMPCDIPIYDILLNWYSCQEEYSDKSKDGFLKMLMVVLCWGSEAQRTDIINMIQYNKDNMRDYLYRVSERTLLKCLIYLWCHGQTPSFFMILQIVGGLDDLIEASCHDAGILLLAVVSIVRAQYFSHFQIATISEDGLSQFWNDIRDGCYNHNIDSDNLMETGLPVIAKDAILTLLNQDYIIQEEFQILYAGRYLKWLKRLVHNIPYCYDLECFLNSSMTTFNTSYIDPFI